MHFMRSITHNHSMFHNTTNASAFVFGNQTETLEHLNARFSEALLPLTVTFGVFTFIGFFGNLIIILVFVLSRDYRRNNFKVFVLTLAVIDIITCVTLIPAEMVKQRHYFDFGDVIPCKVKCFFNVFGAAASCLALLVISVDRYRKVVQPFKKQLGPKLAMKILFVVAFVLPIIFAVPGTIMCGINKSYKRNMYGGLTEIYMCETEDKFRTSVWRTVYKFVFVILLVGISLTYLVLYACVMKEAIKQIRAIARLRRNSSHEVTNSSDVYDPNKIHLKQKLRNDNGRRLSFNANNGLADKVPVKRHAYSLILKRSTQFSIRSMSSRAPRIRLHKFPAKTLVWFVLTIIFIISYITHIILALKVSDIVNMSTDKFACFSFFFRIYFVNHIINPLVYTLFVKSFRRSCTKLIPLLKQRVCQCYW